jgi:hypothetical protein
MCANMRDTSLLQTDSNQMVKFICGLLLQVTPEKTGGVPMSVMSIKDDDLSETISKTIWPCENFERLKNLLRNSYFGRCQKK